MFSVAMVQLTKIFFVTKLFAVFFSCWIEEKGQYDIG